MIPPLFRRCPDCGHVAPFGRFRVETAGDGRRLVECPVCGHRFRSTDDPLLN
jgi:transposase